MSVAIVCIGTELTRGEVENSNASWLCRQLVAMGAEVGAMETIPDHAATIAETLTRLGARHPFLVCTGGLGPTTDDITSQTVAQCLGVELVRHEPALEKLRERLARYNIALTDSNAKQADLPAGAEICANDWGTAPGFSVKIGRAHAFFFPGVPREMQPLFMRDVAPRVAQSLAAHTAQVRIRTFGAPESRVNDLLTGVEAQYGVTVGYRAHFPEIEVKPMATRNARAEADLAVAAAAAEVKRRLGDLVYGEGDNGLTEVVGNLLRQRGWTLGFAESCTGGMLSAMLTASSCSDYYLGAVVSYANSVKQGVLGVSPEVLQEHGAVSQQTVEAMATGARRVLGCDVALAVSGIAGPTGGTPDKPVGLVHLGLATPHGVTAMHRVFAVERVRVQRWAAFWGLDMIRRALLVQD